MDKQPSEYGQKWLKAINDSWEDAKEDGWVGDAQRAVTAYTGKKKAGYDGDTYNHNILFSNTETIAPAIYNSTPNPDIRDRFKTQEPAVKVAADIQEANIRAEIDDNRLDEPVEAAIMDMLTAGRGVVRIEFDFTEGPEEEITGESLNFRHVPWADYRHGKAMWWEDRQWEAFRHHLPKSEIERISDDETVKKQVESLWGAEDEKGDYIVWEIWDKSKREVALIRNDGIELNRMDDPLELQDFFSVKRPWQPIGLPGDLNPVVPFAAYEALAKELDKVTRRINKIMAGMKVKGGIAASTGDMERLTSADDNEIITLGDIEGLAQTGRLDQAIMWWPIEVYIAALNQLAQHRTLIKQEIYEVTGISDIVRGQSNAAETARAQEIKSEWGSQRIQKMQRMVQRGIRDLFVMGTEIMASKYSLETLAKRSNIQITPEVAEVLKDPLQYHKIDVETDSTIANDVTRIKQNMNEFLQGTTAYMIAVAPLVQEAPQAAGPLMELYSVFAGQFNMGQKAEQAIEQITAIAQQAGQQAGQKPDENAGEAQKLQMEGQAKQAEMQLKMQELQAETQEAAAKLQMEKEQFERKMAFEEAKLLAEREDAQRKHELEMAKLSHDAENGAIAARQKDQEIEIKRGAEIGTQIEPLSQAIEQMGGQLAQTTELTVSEIGAVQAAMQAIALARKEVVRDASGNAVAIRSIAPEGTPDEIRAMIEAPQEIQRDERGQIVGAAA